MVSSIPKTEASFAATAAREAVAALYPTQVIDPSSPAFADTQNSFWNLHQREKAPTCFFQPTGAKQVEKAMDEVLDHIEIADDKQTVRVGPGVRWGNLFEVLEKEGVIAVGGRDFGVGVPGFVFGGGISYLSASEGWGVDNLVSADIVLASGELITVNSTSHPELNRALHGGGAHNFGIVTSLTLKLHPYQGMWGGMNVVKEEHFDSLFEAYDVYTRDVINGDTNAHLIVDIFRRDGVMVAAQFMGYSAPSADPPIFDRMRRIPNVASTLRLADWSNLALEMQEVTDSRGNRNAYWTLAFGYDIELLKSVYTLWSGMTEPYAPRFRVALDINLITPAMRNKAAREVQGNVYGLNGPDELLTNILLTAVWQEASDDEEVNDILRDLGTAIEVLARERGKAHPFKYMNYAHQEQDVIAGFGEENKAFLKEVAAKYDPKGVFQKLQQSGFKLDGTGART